jgi:hypothetical protein
VFAVGDPLKGRRGTEELDASGGVRVDARQLGDTEQAVSTMLGSRHVSEPCGAVEVAFEEGGHRRGQTGLPVQRFQYGAQFGRAVGGC